jgi:hypothetical protein
MCIDVLRCASAWCAMEEGGLWIMQSKVGESGAYATSDKATGAT